jgi:hypothetical protein
MSGTPVTPSSGGDGQGQHPPGAYPIQQLSEQRVERGRSRMPMLVALVVAVLLAVGGVVAYFAVSARGGGGNRAAYCTELRKATHGGHLSKVLPGRASTADPLSELTKLRRLAPGSVRAHWAHLSKVASQARAGQVPIDALGLLNDATAIRDDAKSGCHLDIGL